ncbi:hypothetical protein I3271_00960 [Photobacterium leiognathi]|uniref:hypothetical protein n=1 Tax=Photobacterium leiognathi TaxID=553611 RepID=UPI001EDF7A36|nr:hypothetical protein [Photobacterium leiognathi]MCG3883252.1 hypothetical protein [Photobacterium leiognathi]
MENKIKLTVLAGSLATLLTGCGGDSQLDQASFISGDNDFDNVVAYSFSEEQGKKIDEEIKNDVQVKEMKAARKSFNALANMDTDEITVESTAEYIKTLKAIDFDVKPIEKAVKDLASTNAKIHSEGEVKVKAVISIYDEKVANAKKSVQSAEESLAKFNKEIEPITSKMNDLATKSKENEDKLKAMNEKYLAALNKLIVEKEIPSSVDNNRANLRINGWRKTSADRCDEAYQVYGQNGVCYTFNSWDYRGNIDKAYIDQIKPIFNEFAPEAIKFTLSNNELSQQYNKLNTELSKAKVIAGNKFGTEYKLKNALSKAQRELKILTEYDSPYKEDGTVDYDKYEIKQIFYKLANSYGIDRYSNPVRSYLSDNSTKFYKDLEAIKIASAIKAFKDNAHEVSISDSGKFDMPKLSSDKDEALVFIDMSRVKGAKCQTIVLREDKRHPAAELYNKQNSKCFQENFEKMVSLM